MSRPHVDELFAMSREMNGQSVDVDFGKHETAHHICFEFWFSDLALGSRRARAGNCAQTSNRKLLRTSAPPRASDLPFPASVVNTDARKVETVSATGVVVLSHERLRPT